MVKYDLAVKYGSSPLLLATLFFFGLSASAQTQPPSCEPPAAQTYLLLIADATQSAQERLRLALPDTLNPQTCQYLDQTVIRLGTFTQLDTADQWGQYIQDLTGLSTVIATPSTTQTSSTVTTAPALQPFDPQPLDSGYAVLVNYFNEPETASQLQDFLEAEIGLVSYLARPYLLAWQTQSEKEANRVLQQLSKQGFWAVVVNSGRATLLTPAINYSEPTLPPETR